MQRTHNWKSTCENDSSGWKQQATTLRNRSQRVDAGDSRFTPVAVKHNAKLCETESKVWIEMQSSNTVVLSFLSYDDGAVINEMNIFCWSFSGSIQQRHTKTMFGASGTKSTHYIRAEKLSSHYTDESNIYSYLVIRSKSPAESVPSRPVYGPKIQNYDFRMVLKIILASLSKQILFIQNSDLNGIRYTFRFLYRFR